MIPARTVAAPFSVSVTAVIFRFTWYLSLTSLLYSTCVASASIIAVRRGGDVLPSISARSLAIPFTSNSLIAPAKRSPTEHVILCDCISASGIRSSQMAYYSGDVNGLPTGGVGIVDTEFNTTAAWYNETTSATWLDTGVTFKAVIRYHVAEGDYVGKGNNGYGDFRCWQRSNTEFAFDYKGDGNVCEMRIDCNKDPAPANDPPYVPLETTTSTSTDDDQAAGSSATSSPSHPEDKKDKAISTGAVIGIAIGIVGAFTFLAGSAGFFFARRRRIRKRRQRQQEEEAQGRKSTITESTMTEAYAPGSDFVKNDGGNPNAVYELDGGWYRHEMGDDTGHYEIDGQVRCEVDGEEGEIKKKMDDLFAEADVKEVIILNEKGDSKKVMLDEKEEKKGYVVGISEKEKEEQEREREQEQQKQQLEDQKRNRDAEEQPISPVSPSSPLSPTTTSPWIEEVGHTPFRLPAIMPEPEKFMAEEFRAVYKERPKDETDIKFRFEVEETQKYMKEEETQKYMKGEVSSTGGGGAAGSGINTRVHGDK